jgi:hypothetical protein
MKHTAQESKRKKINSVVSSVNKCTAMMNRKFSSFKDFNLEQKIFSPFFFLSFSFIPFFSHRLSPGEFVVKRRKTLEKLLYFQ